MSPIDEPSRGNLVIVEANLTCLSLQQSEKSAHASFIIAIDFFLSLSFSPIILNASNSFLLSIRRGITFLKKQIGKQIDKFNGKQENESSNRAIGEKLADQSRSDKARASTIRRVNAKLDQLSNEADFIIRAGSGGPRILVAITLISRDRPMIRNRLINGNPLFTAAPRFRNRPR